MPLDASIYSNIQPVQAPSVADAASKAITLSNLGLANQQAQLQNRQMQYQMAQTQAIRDAYAKNMNPDGTLNKQGVLSDLTRSGYGQAAAGLNQTFATQDKAQADLQNAHATAMKNIADATMGDLLYLKGANPKDQPMLYQSIMQKFADNGIPMHNVPAQFDKAWLDRTIGALQNSQSYAQRQQTIAKTQEAIANAGGAAAKRNVDLYGSRSPDVALSHQYDQDVKQIRGSQIAMAQMMDNYQHPSPQGDASLILNAFKIKFPNAPDVNSLEELSKAQAVPDQWRQAAAHALSGGLDTNTRQNLMRDAISTYRANYNSYQGIAKRYNARAAQQGVNDPTLTYEPALDQTYQDAMNFQKNIGAYIPPSQRGGIVSGAANLLSKVVGVGSPKTAAAAAPQIKPGTVEDGYIFYGGNAGDPSNWKKVK